MSDIIRSILLFVVICIVFSATGLSAESVGISPTHTVSLSPAASDPDHASFWMILFEVIGIVAVISLAILVAFRPINPLRLSPRKAVRAQSGARLNPQAH